MDGSRNLLTPDLQASPPEVRLGLSRAGVTGVEKAIRLRWDETEKLIPARIDCTVDLDPAQKGDPAPTVVEIPPAPTADNRARSP